MSHLCEEAGWFLPHSSQSFTISNKNKADSFAVDPEERQRQAQGRRSTIPCCWS